MAAERDLREFVKRDPSNIFANFYLGETLFRQEKYAEAVSAAQSSLHWQRQYVAARSAEACMILEHIGVWQESQGDYRAALASLEDVAVLGHRRQSWLSARLLGSTSEAVLNHARCSVVIVPFEQPG